MSQAKEHVTNSYGARRLHSPLMGLCCWCCCCVAVAAAAVAAALAAAALQQAAAAVASHHMECGKVQATNSACHSVASLVGALAFTSQIEDTLMLAV